MTVVELDGVDPKPEVILDQPRRFGGPEWTPDGRLLVTTDSHLDDGLQFSPDGRWIYRFQSGG